LSAFAAHANIACKANASSADPPPKTPKPVVPRVRRSTCQKRVKGEELVFVREGASRGGEGPSWSLYCVCDGHRGRGAALYVKDHLWSVLAPLLPRTRLPEDYGRDFSRFSMKVSAAITEALLEVGEQFAAHSNDLVSGATVTLALLCGRLLTIANVGDSKAVVETGRQSLLATVSHRLEDSKAERQRLAKAGMVLTMGRSESGTAVPSGEALDCLSCYPGGLPFSRTIGNIEAGKHIVSFPHICQVVVPENGLSVLIGSGSLWNMIRWSRAAEIIRKSDIKGAAAAVVKAAVKHCGCSYTEDVTALVLEIFAPREDLLDRDANSSGPLKARLASGCGRLLAACLCGYSDSATAENWPMDSDGLLVVSRVDGLDLVKAAMQQDDSRLSRLASGCLPQDAAKAPSRAMPREWAPAFLTAQRATLGMSSSGSAWAPVRVPPPTRSKSRTMSACFMGKSS